MQRRPFFCEDRLAAVAVLLASLIYGWNARIIGGLGSDDVVGPGGLPILIAMAGVGLGGWLFLSPANDIEFEPIGGRVWLYWVGFGVYALLIPVAGFGISTLIFLSAIFISLRAPAIRAVTIAGATTLVLWFVFARLLDVRISLIPWS